MISSQNSPLMTHPIKNSLNVQLPSNVSVKNNRRMFPLSPQTYDRNNNHRYLADSPGSDEILSHSSNFSILGHSVMPVEHLTNHPAAFPNLITISHHEERMRKAYSADASFRLCSNERFVREKKRFSRHRRK